jgi:phosphate/phosphite/phosphonate ABC transporter binding protein
MSRDDNPPGAPPLERTEVVPPQPIIGGKYKLGRQIGEGGMGAVYEALHVGLGTKVAVKILSEQLAENPTFVKRFRREARAAAAVQHENVVAVTDTGEDEEGVPYLIMELLEGETLAATLRRERVLIPQAAAEVTAQMLRGLGAAHEKGVIHRDLKPGNIFLARQSDGTYRVKVLDFGISKFSADVSNLNVTVEGTIVGTPNFMAPEQVMGKHDVDPRADLYAVGVMMYRMLTGKLPYAGTSSKEVYDKIIQGTPLKPHQIRPDIPAALENVIVKSMSRRAADRYQSAQEFLDALREAVPSLDTGTSRPGLPSITVGGSMEDVDAGDDGPRSKTSARTRSDRPGAGDSMRRVTTPLAPAYNPPGAPAEIPKAAAVPGAASQAKQTWFTSVAILVILLAASAIAYAGWSMFSPNPVVKDGEPEPAVGTGLPVLRYVVRQFASDAEVKATHEPVRQYLSEALKREVELVIVGGHDDVGKEMRANPLAITAFPALAYVQSAGEGDAPVLLAGSVMETGRSYQGAIVARQDSGFKRLDDLKDKTFCFVGGKKSASGYLYPRALLRRSGIDPDRFFTTRSLNDHEEGLRAVYEKTCDAAAVYEGMVQKAPALGMEQVFSVLAHTAPIPYDAYCMSARAPKDLVEATQEALLALAPESELARRRLGASNQLRGFVVTSDADYESVRDMAQFIDTFEKKK